MLLLCAPDGRIFDVASTGAGGTPQVARVDGEGAGPKISKRGWPGATPAPSPCSTPTSGRKPPTHFGRSWRGGRTTRMPPASWPRRPGRRSWLRTTLRGRTRIATQAWATAIEQLQAILAVDAGYRDAAALLAGAKRRKALAELYAEARRLHEAGTWPAVIKVFERIATVDPAYPDPGNLARIRPPAAVEADERERRLAGIYSQGRPRPGRREADRGAGPAPGGAEPLARLCPGGSPDRA